jgi:drug/metabolite transporter (DMT)-like permease
MEVRTAPERTELTVGQGRLLIVLAAVCWSTSGALTKILTRETPFGLNSPPVAPLLIACLRVAFAAVVLLPMVRRRDISFRPLMIVMVLCFAIMNATFVSALALGTAANAIVLQYTAPMWMYLASVRWLGEAADQRNLIALAIGLTGIAVIVSGGWQGGELPVIGLALLSGITYAGVLVCLRVLRHASSRWLTVLNLSVSGLALAPFLLSQAAPSGSQLVVLFLYGAAQMAVPYWLVARGLRVVNPQEAGMLTLLEPLLNPAWAYLVSGERPELFSLIGGAIILTGLVWRYWPFPRKSV